MSAINPQSVAKNNSSTAFLTALAANGGILVIEVGAFLILKRRLWRIYSPRTVLAPPDKRAPELPSGPWKWIPALISSPSQDIIHKNGLDAYMFLRFLKLLIVVSLVFTVITFVSIVPANAAFLPASHTGLDQISWSNITQPSDQARFSAHVIVVYVLTAFVIYLIHREMLHFTHMRHQFLIDESHSRLAQARTVLVTSVPDELANEHDLRLFASFVPGGIDRVWMYRDTKALNKLFDRRVDACRKLESAEAAILKSATLAWRKRVKQHHKEQNRRLNDEENNKESENLLKPPPSMELLNDLVPPNHRPRHRTGFLGLFGPKVDTIDWCKNEISRLNKDIKEKREHIVKGKFLGSVFIRCNLQVGAHVLAQCLSYHEPLKMDNKTMEAHPKDIVWRNLDDGALEMRSRYVASWLATIGLIIAWTFPVGFIGTLSQLAELCVKVHWLEWVCRAPPVARGLLQGVLPPLLLALLFALLPLILRALAWYECIPRYSLISVSVYRRFYLFLLIHGFLIVTLTSGITSAIEGIVTNPTQTVQKLSSQLPGASVFFLTYMLAQGLAGAGGALVQLTTLIFHYTRKWLLGRTPRQAFKVTFQMPSTDFGVIMPGLSLLATITFAYSVLAPLINFLALISFGMLYVAWKFLLTQVFDQPDEKETGGLYFPMAINNLFVGLYIEQICLTCLFFLKVSSAKEAAIIEAVFMIVLIVLTAIAHVFIHNSFSPLRLYLPMSLATKEMAKRYSRPSGQGGPAGDEDYDDLDLFSRDRIRNFRRRITKTTKRFDGQLEKLKTRVRGTEYPNCSSTDDPQSDSRELDDNKRATDETVVASSTTRPDFDQSERYSGDLYRLRHSRMFDATALGPNNSDLSGEDEDIHEFDHPSTYVNQSWIWIPKDTLGLSACLAEELKGAGVAASDVGAIMDDKGVVEVTRNPPDEKLLDDEQGE